MHIPVRKIAKIPVVGPATLFVIVFLYRVKLAVEIMVRYMFKVITWLVRSKEITNYSYDLDENNLQYLSYLVSSITNVKLSTIVKYVEEIKSNEHLKQHIKKVICESSFSYKSDLEMRLGRRIGWYLIARTLKPRVIVETGVDQGLGSCVLAAALMKNNEEGCPGVYYGTDINPNAGYLFTDEYSKCGKVIYGDSIESLSKLDKKIDLFINDSDHSEKYEAMEYEAIKEKLSESSIILGDNSHISNKLLEFSISVNRQFVFFQERPVNHWYQGAGIGISYNDSRQIT